MNYWVTTFGGTTIGPYDDFASAWYAALNYFGLDVWITTSTAQ